MGDAAGDSVATDSVAAALREQLAGNEAVGRRDWAVAHERYTASLALHPTPAAHSNRSAACLALGRAADAAADARAALALDGTFVRAYLRLSAAQRALGDDAAAVAAAREGLDLALRLNSPLEQQLRDALETAGGAAPPRFERATPRAKAAFRMPCAHCGKTLEHVRMCARCRQVAFCDAACQEAGYPAHRAACKLGAAAMASATAAAGMTQLPSTAHMNALQNFVAGNPDAWGALRCIAWHVQHFPPPEWRTSPGPVMLVVRRTGAEDGTLCVQMTPLELLKGGGIASAGSFRFSDVDLHVQTAGMEATLSRVDIEVGFVVGVPDPRAGGALSIGRVRFGSEEREVAAVRGLAANTARDGTLRVNARDFTAEFDLAMFRHSS